MRIWPRKRFWIWLAIIAGTLMVINAGLAWRAEWRLRSRIAAIRDAGDPASIAELAPEPIPDDENAAAILQRIAPRIAQFADEEGRFFNTPVGKAYDERLDHGELPTAEEIEAIRVIVGKYQDVDAALAATAACDSYASELDFSLPHEQFLEMLIERQSLLRQAVRFLAWEVALDLADKNQDQAGARGLEMLRLGRLYDGEPTLVSFLIGIAIRSMAVEKLYDVLSAGPMPAEYYAELDQELARQDDPQRLVNALKSERAICVDWLPSQVEGHPFAAQVLGWKIKNYQVGALDALEELMELTQRPWYEIQPKFGEPNSVPPSSGHGILADLLLPAVGASFQANARSVALLRCLRIFNALEEFAAQNGREANGLEDLKLPTDATLDPYSGKPLKLKYTEDGWMVYSVMNNGVDDGGDFKDHKDYGVAPRQYRRTE